MNKLIKIVSMVAVSAIGVSAIAFADPAPAQPPVPGPCDAFMSPGMTVTLTQCEAQQASALYTQNIVPYVDDGTYAAPQGAPLTSLPSTQPAGPKMQASAPPANLGSPTPAKLESGNGSLKQASYLQSNAPKQSAKSNKKLFSWLN